MAFADQDVTIRGFLDQSGVESDEPAPDPSLEADKLKHYLEGMDPQDFGKFNP